MVTGRLIIQASTMRADHTMLEAGFFLLTQNHGACNSRSDYMRGANRQATYPGGANKPCRHELSRTPFIGVTCVRPSRSPNVCTMRL
jgi:hypothetical protein